MALPTSTRGRGPVVSIVVRDGVTGEVRQALTGAVSTVSDFRPFWEYLRRHWERRGRDVFATRGKASNTPWPTYDQTAERQVYRYAKASIVGRSVEEVTRRPLRWVDGMERLYPSLTDTAHPNAVYDTTAKLSLRAGTTAEGAANHDRGRGRAPEWAGGHAIPRRPLLRFTRLFVREVDEGLKAVAQTVSRGIESRTDPKRGSGQRIGFDSAAVDEMLRAQGVR